MVAEDSPAGDSMEAADTLAAGTMAEDFPPAAIAAAVTAVAAVMAVDAVTEACAEVLDSRAPPAREEPGRQRAAPAFVTPHPAGIRSHEEMLAEDQVPALPEKEVPQEEAKPEEDLGQGAHLALMPQLPTVSGTLLAEHAAANQGFDRDSHPIPSAAQASAEATLADAAATGDVRAGDGADGDGAAGAAAVGDGDLASDLAGISPGARTGMARLTGIAQGGATFILRPITFTRIRTRIGKRRALAGDFSQHDIVDEARCPDKSSDGDQRAAGDFRHRIERLRIHNLEIIETHRTLAREFLPRRRDQPGSVALTRLRQLLHAL